MMRKVLFLIKLFISSIIFGLFCLGIVLLTSYLLGPPDISTDFMTVLYDGNGEKIENKNNENKYVELDQISPYLIDATILAEDKHFYEHHGFDFRGILRAVIKNIQSSRLKEGASTITQQYARNLYLTHEKTWIRKLKEAFYTIRLEMFYSKDEILTGYLNSIYYGHGAYGIESASHVYFDKSVSDLTIAEAAMLAGIPKGPTYYSPFNNEENAFNRQQFILTLLVDEQIITEADYYTAKQEKLEFSEPHIVASTFAAYFEDVVLKEAQQILHGEEESILTGGYKIYTTLDSDLQRETENSIKKQVDDSSNIEIGVISMEPESGAILSLVGGREYKTSTFNRAIDAKRMVGSSFKPFLYYAALENGYTPTTMLLSEPTSFVLEDEHVYNPSNYNGYYAYKPISLAQAIALSDNIYAVKTNLFLHPKEVIATTRKFGITSDLPNVPSLALGSASISLVEMVNAYGVLANGGNEVEHYTIEKMINQQGKVIYERNETEEKQVLDPNKTFILTHLMTGMFDRRLNGYMEVTGSSIIDKLSHSYAGKSGTTDTDNWMIGFSPSIVTGVWTGYDNNEPIQKMDEKAIAKNVWADAIEAAHDPNDDTIKFHVPKGVVKKTIDPETGLLATTDCDISVAMYFEKGTEPTQYCTDHLPENEDGTSEEESDDFLKKLFELFR
ncbi:transglycosylase domain-containing protein [Pseudogracilibacillus auburnensis]|uniref:transglycosylase domain-containing protein n=1 Tax=Pseudogracilibacillus auburnensis TaxID=1494959 RepID=UPI001F611414|nr:transglycosylase domain-containing protein [Pseudogracilibacillus auburnensis]